MENATGLFLRNHVASTWDANFRRNTSHVAWKHFCCHANWNPERYCDSLLLGTRTKKISFSLMLRFFTLVTVGRNQPSIESIDINRDPQSRLKYGRALDSTGRPFWSNKRQLNSLYVVVLDKILIKTFSQRLQSPQSCPTPSAEQPQGASSHKNSQVQSLKVHINAEGRSNLCSLPQASHSVDECKSTVCLHFLVFVHSLWLRA